MRVKLVVAIRRPVRVHHCRHVITGGLAVSSGQAEGAQDGCKNHPY
ncbi:MAG: hypothetical protein Q7J07_07550 [Pelolinea sp.]|nr:hypothetical protein [Pelolinea sp.]